MSKWEPTTGAIVYRGGTSWEKYVVIEGEDITVGSIRTRQRIRFPLGKTHAICRLVPAPEPAAGERGWRDFYNEVMRRAEQEDDATVYADRIAYHLDIVAEEWGKEGESND